MLEFPTLTPDVNTYLTHRLEHFRSKFHRQHPAIICRIVKSPTQNCDLVRTRCGRNLKIYMDGVITECSTSRNYTLCSGGLDSISHLTERAMIRVRYAPVTGVALGLQRWPFLEFPPAISIRSPAIATKLIIPPRQQVTTPTSENLVKQS